MSNKSPIPSSPCDVCTGWLQCKLKAAICWAQSKIDFLCERGTAKELSVPEKVVLLSDWTRFHEEFGASVVSERCIKADYTDRAAFKDWATCACAHGFVLSYAAQQVLNGRLTLANKAGLLPVAGLTCMCCAGYRVWGALLLGFAAGWFF